MLWNASLSVCSVAFAGVYVLARMFCRDVLACVCFFTSDRLVCVEKSTTLEVLSIDIIAMAMDATIASNHLEWCTKFAFTNKQQEAMIVSEAERTFAQ